MKRLMKTKFLIFTIVALRIFTSCATDLGGLSFQGIDILRDGARLEAHGYEYVFPSDKGQYELYVISDGVERIDILENGADITVECPVFPPQGESYEGIDDNAQYLQKIIVDVPENTSHRNRKSVIRVFDKYSMNPTAADITICQAGK